LVPEDLVAGAVDLIGCLAFVLLPGINGAELAIPDSESTLIHPLALFLVAAEKTTLLLIAGNVGGVVGEAEGGVVVDRVSGVVPVLVGVTETGEVRRKGVSIEVNGVVGINGADSLVDAVVEGDDAGVGVISGLVQGVVASDPLVALVVSSKLFPEPDDAILEVLVVPD